MSDYDRIAKAIEFINDHYSRQPALKEVARAAGLSEFHFQRLFRRWAGISPKRFLQFLTAEHARAMLDGSNDIFDAMHQTGLSSSGRLHDLFVNVYAATPAQVRQSGAGLEVRYGVADTPFGHCLVARTERGICGLSFVERNGENEAIVNLRKRWSRALFRLDQRMANDTVKQIFSAAKRANDKPLTIFLQGTNFQLKVWEALLRIPPGKAATYSDIAEAVGAPSAVRAVGSAIGNNPVAFVIPCHRVLRKSGAFGEYQWGAERKQAILGWEASKYGTTIGDAA